jgi:hypothetical protein
VETSEAKAERLWGEVKELNKKVDDAFDDLKAKGVVFDEKDEKKREELKKRIAAGDIAAQEELQKLEARMVEKAKRDHPELSKEFGEMEKLLKERDKAFKEYIEAEKKSGKYSATELEKAEKDYEEKTKELTSKDQETAKKTAQSDVDYYGGKLKDAQKKQQAGAGAAQLEEKTAKLAVIDVSQAEDKSPPHTPQKPSAVGIEIRGD